MSTYEICEALEALKTRALAEGNGLLMEQHARATLEVEAIERAAKALKKWNDAGQAPLDADAARGWSVVESIAKDAP